MKITRELAKFNNIKFHDKEHIYYLDGKRTKSVTAIIAKYKHPFDKDYWSQKKADERGITKEEILKEWKYKADFSCEKGSTFHEYAENFLSNKLFTDIPDGFISTNFSGDILYCIIKCG